MLYSKQVQTAGGSGFLFDDHEKPPADAFGVAQADVDTALSLPSGSTYTFTPPIPPSTTGALIVTPASEPTAAQALEQVQASRRAAILAALAAIDAKTPRALRDIALGGSADRAKALEAQACDLRAELATLRPS